MLQCSKQHDLQNPKHGNNPSAYQQTTDLRRCGIHTYNGIIVLTKNEVWPFAATWTDLENIMLSEVSQTDKDKYYMIQFISEI